MALQRRTTLTKYLIEQQRETNNLPADLRLLIEVVARACKAISYHVSKGALGDALGTAGSENVQGEVQKKLDILSNDILLEANEWGGNLAGMASEEMEKFSPIPANYPKGEYLLVFDPLDGSSNIDVNVSIGTIFSVLRCPDGQQPTEQSFLQPGTQQVAAGYAVYGPQTVLVLTTGNGVNCFTLDRELGSWVLTQSDMTIPVVLTVYSDRSFSMILKTPPTSVLLKKAAGLSTGKKPGSGSKEPNKNKVGKVTMKQVRELANQKMSDMNCTDVESAMRTVMGTARSMGIDVVE